MTDDRMNMIRHAAEECARKDTGMKIDPRDVLNLIDMVENYGAEIDRLSQALTLMQNGEVCS